MFFIPVHNLPADIKKSYLKILTKIKQNSKEIKLSKEIKTSKEIKISKEMKTSKEIKLSKEIKILKEIISNPPKSISIKNILVYSYALRRLKELQEL